jgi:Holliday junction resolvase RusA-like endonuclease
MYAYDQNSPIYIFHLEGRIKPYVRMTQAGKWVKRQAQEYLTSKENLQWQLKSQMQDHSWIMFPTKIALGAIISFHPARHNCDLDNLVKALLDAAQGVVFKDDRWVDFIKATRSDSEQDDVAILTVFIIAKQVSNAQGPP